MSQSEPILPCSLGGVRHEWFWRSPHSWVSWGQQQWWAGEEENGRGFHPIFIFPTCLPLLLSPAECRGKVGSAESRRGLDFLPAVWTISPWLLLLQHGPKDRVWLCHYSPTEFTPGKIDVLGCGKLFGSPWKMVFFFQQSELLLVYAKGSSSTASYIYCLSAEAWNSLLIEFNGNYLYLDYTLNYPLACLGKSRYLEKKVFKDCHDTHP